MKDPIHTICLDVRGAFSEGFIPGTDRPQRWNYRRSPQRFSNCVSQNDHPLVLCRQCDYKNDWKDARSPGQLRTRRRIQAATNAWHVLTEPEKQVWRIKAKKLKHTGFNEFIRQFCRKHPVAEFDNFVEFNPNPKRILLPAPLL